MLELHDTVSVKDPTYDELSPTTLPSLMRKSVRDYKNHKALMFKSDTGEWKGITYDDYYKTVEKTAKIFIKLGLQKKGVVAILAHNSIEWLISELAAVYAG